MEKSHYITLEDNLANSNRQLFSLRKTIVKDKVAIGEIGDLLPVGVCMNDFTGNQFMNVVGEDIFRRDRSEIKEMKESYFDTCFYLEDVIALNCRALSQISNLRKGQVLSTFIPVRRPHKTNDQLVYQAFTIIPNKDSYRALIVGMGPEQLGISNRKLSRIIEEDEMVIRYFELFQTLTSREKEIISLVVYGHNNPKIADMLCISRYTVETHRKNINRKLDLHSYYQLVRFAQAFDLV